MPHPRQPETEPRRTKPDRQGCICPSHNPSGLKCGPELSAKR
ncbi:MAG: hypothetical protein LAN62_13540 [Acidobacteriia bacterium]|nr:hypothetical protein [Terriglobia bacterium]